jgi:predicted AlkP superfamily phosphohydrolase/phosphomutase/tetratricopeptide (TPR) repeat protein
MKPSERLARVLLVGWDAADWKVASPLVDRREMPNLERLIDRGVMADLATLQPVLSPMLWNTIATGHRPDRHGIHGFTEVDEHSGEIRAVSSLSRRCKALWNVLTQSGRRVHSINWFGSHPAEPIRGICVSDAYTQGIEQLGGPPSLAPGTVHPSELTEEFANLRLGIEEVDEALLALFVPQIAEVDQDRDTRLATIARLIAETLTVHNAATRVLEEEPWDLVAIYYPGIDHFSHGFMDFHPPRLEGVSEELFTLYSDVVNSAYRLHDLLLGRLLVLAGPDTAVLLVSDHGYHSDHLRILETPQVPTGPSYHHRDHGILVLAGPGIKSDERIYGVGLLDITPTVLTLLGLPVGRDMEGRVLLEAFTEPPEIQTIPSWEELPGEAGRHGPNVTMAPQDTTLLLDQFAALGYLNPEELGHDQAVAATRRENDWNLARAHLDAGRPERAIPLLEQLCANWPERLDFGLTLAEALCLMGALDEARELIEALIHHHRETPQARYLLGVIAAEQESPQAALEHLRAAEAAYAERPELHVQIGFAALRLGEVETAERAFARANSLDPHYAPAWTGRAACAASLGQWEDTERFALEAVSLAFHAPMAHLLLGEARLRQGRCDEADLALGVACQLVPEWLYPRQLRARLWAGAADGPGRARAEAAQVALRAAETHCTERRRFQAEFHSEARRATLHLLNQTYIRQAAAATSDPEHPDPSVPLELVLVSGLPRSGTSLVMQMLQRGGATILTDGQRVPDEDNPEGYLEWEPIQRLPRQPEVLRQAAGKVIKVLTPLLRYLPGQHHYKVIFLDRPIDEVLASQSVMRRRRDRPDPVDPARLPEALESHRREALAYLERSPNVSVLLVPYPELVARPQQWAARLAEFLGFAVVPEPEHMADAVQPQLYRQRSQSDITQPESAPAPQTHRRTLA